MKPRSMVLLGWRATVGVLTAFQNDLDGEEWVAELLEHKTSLREHIGKRVEIKLDGGYSDALIEYRPRIASEKEGTPYSRLKADVRSLMRKTGIL